jgi:DNA-binding NarL/FixJ family response regulator
MEYGESLTSREREIFSAVDAGLSNREIAEHLSISESMVAYHIDNVHKKLGVMFWRPLARRLIFFRARHFYTICVLGLLVYRIYDWLS